MALDLNAVMDAIGTALGAIDGLRVVDYAAESVNPPQAIVALPEGVEYDVTMARGADRAVVPVSILVGKVSDRASRRNIAAYLSGTGASSVKTAVEAGSVGQTTRVTNARVEIVSVGAVEYLGASFDVEVIA